MVILNAIIRFLFRRPYRFIKRHLYKLLITYMIGVVPMGVTTTTLTTGTSPLNYDSVIKIYKNAGVTNMVTAGLYKPTVNGIRVVAGEVTKFIGTTFNSENVEETGRNLINRGKSWFNQGKILAGGTIESSSASGITADADSDSDDKWSFSKYPDYYKIVGLSGLKKEDIETKEYVKYYDKDESGRHTGVESVISRDTILASASSNPKSVDGKALQLDFKDSDKIQGWNDKLSTYKVNVPWLYGQSNKSVLWEKSLLLPIALGGSAVIDNSIVLTHQCNVGGTDNKGGLNYITQTVKSYFDNHKNGLIKYVAIPNYTGNNKIPETVTVKLLSNDNELDETVLLFNTANNYTLNYSDGSYKSE